jgi:pilus assembly protein CpaC
MMKALTLLFVSFLMVGVGISPDLVSVAEAEAVEVNTPQVLRLTVGESKIVEPGSPFKRASVANPDVADQIVLSTKQLYLAGIAVGTTTLTLWGNDGKVSNVFNVQVSPDISRLKEQIHILLPAEKGVTVTAAHGHITLTGQVSSRDIKDQVGKLAAAYAPQKVLNFLKYPNK